MKTYEEEQAEATKKIVTRTILGVLGFLILITALSAAFIIPAGAVGVVRKFGAVERVAYPGMNFKIPFAETVTKMSVRTLKHEVDAAAASKDLQVVTSRIAVNYHLDGRYAVDMFQNVGPDYLNIIIEPAIQNIFKATTAKYTAEQLITNREAVRSEAEKALDANLSEYHVVVENFNIVNFDFSPEYNEAIERKQVAQQEVETAKQIREKKRVEAEALIIEAQGKSAAQKEIAISLTPEYLQYLWLTMWDGHLPSVMGGAVPFFDTSKYVTGAQP